MGKRRVKYVPKHDDYCRGVPKDGVWDFTCTGCIELIETKLCSIEMDNPNEFVCMAQTTTLRATIAARVIEALGEGSDP